MKKYPELLVIRKNKFKSQSDTSAHLRMAITKRQTTPNTGQVELPDSHTLLV